MEEIRDAALAYYENLPKEGRKRADKMFKEMDKDGDKKVDFDEYALFLSKMGRSTENLRELFSLLDKDGNDTLDFNEFITLYYLNLSERILFCAGPRCRIFLKGMYFSCVDCFHSPERDSYHLCCACYRKKKERRKNHNHKGAVFLDNYAFLKAMGLATTPNGEGSSATHAQSQSSANTDLAIQRQNLFHLLQLGVNITAIVSNAVASCNIM